MLPIFAIAAGAALVGWGYEELTKPKKSSKTNYEGANNVPSGKKDENRLESGGLDSGGVSDSSLFDSAVGVPQPTVTTKGKSNVSENNVVDSGNSAG